MADLVTDISIVAGWGPRIEGSAAEVFIYTQQKITPQPTIKVSLLHLQSLIAKTTLLCVTPLLPDGSSPRESPGIRALGIPVVAGGNHTAPYTLVRQRRVNESALDGVGSAASSDTAEYIANDNDEDMEHAVQEWGAERTNEKLELIKDRLVSHGPKISPRNRKWNISNSIITKASSDCEDTFSRPNSRDTLSFPDFGQRYRRLSDGSVASEVGISYSRGSNGSFKPVEFSGWQRKISCSNNSWNPVGPRKYKRKARFGSIGSVQRGLSPMSEKTLRRIVELNTSISGVDIGKQDGTIEDLEVELRFSELATEDAAAKGYRSTENDDLIAVEGEMARQEISIGNAGMVAVECEVAKHEVSKGELEPGEIECDETTIVVENDTLFICFPTKIRGDAIVVEIMLEVNPLYLDGKPYATFILAGLPRCDNGAYIDFRVEDEDTWKFHAFPGFTSIDTGGAEENKLHGILDLSGKPRNVYLDRSIIIRALRYPMILEVLDFKMKTDVTASFSWSPINEKIVVDFEINFFFLGVESDEDAKRSVINFFLINGPERQEDLSVDSPGGSPTDFALGDLDFENYEINARRCRLLRVERLTGDVNQPLRILFSKKLASVTQEIGVPIIRIGGEATLTEESVTVTNAKLPLKVVFSANSTSWKESNKKPGVNLSKRFTRTGINMREANPSLFISCLQPAVSPTAEAMGRALLRSCDGLIGRIDYDIEESGSLDDRGIPTVVIKMSFELDTPTRIEPMGETIRIHAGSFGLQFVTINKRLTEKGVLFEDGDELVVSDCGIFGGSKDNNKLLINTEWLGQQGLNLSCGEVMEFRLPRVVAKVVGRAVFGCSNRRARVISRMHPGSSVAISGFTKGKAIILGMDTSKDEVFLQIPCEGGEKGLHKAITQSSACYSLCDMESTVTPKASSAQSLHSPHNEDPESVQEQGQEQPEGPTQSTDQRRRNVSHWMWEMKETLILVVIIGLLCFSLISLSARNSMLRASLQQATVMLEEKERINNWETFLDPPHFQSQKGGSEDLWWSVVGLEDTQETGRFKGGLLTMASRNVDPNTYGATETGDCEGLAAAKIGGEGIGEEKYLGEENQADAIEPRQELEAFGGLEGRVGQVGEENQKKIAQLLVESSTEKTQHILVNVLRFFWYLVFGIYVTYRKRVTFLT